MAAFSSGSFTGLFNCTQFCRATARSVSVEMSPVRMTAGTCCFRVSRSCPVNCSPFSPLGRLKSARIRSGPAAPAATHSRAAMPSPAVITR